MSMFLRAIPGRQVLVFGGKIYTHFEIMRSRPLVLLILSILSMLMIVLKDIARLVMLLSIFDCHVKPYWPLKIIWRIKYIGVWRNLI